MTNLVLELDLDGMPEGMAITDRTSDTPRGTARRTLRNAVDSQPNHGGTHTISHTISDTPTRRCPRCGETKPREAFGTRRNGGRLCAQTYCRVCMVEYHATWRRTPAGGEAFTRSQHASRARYPERHAARQAVASAIGSGRLVRGACELAGDDCRGGIDAHHDDYSKPLDVRWVCRAHHRPLDRARAAFSAPGARGARRDD